MKLSLIMFLLTTVPTAAKAASPNYSGDATQFVSYLAAGHYDAVEKIFTPQMARAMPAEKLRAVWSAVIAKVGEFQKIENTNLTTVQGYHVVVVTCQFQKGDLGLRVVLDSKERVAGLFFVPAPAKKSWSAPRYVQPSRFHEGAVAVVYERWRLPGTLTLPDGKGPFPGIVLVHGSGPADGDETIGPSKVFKDPAWGLASRGTTVLRYAKRTRQYGPAAAPRNGELTVNDTTVNDARAAVALLAAQPEIDPHRVFVLGHSRGGEMAPRIAATNPDVAGIVIMAGPTRPEGQIWVDQVKYLTSVEDPTTPQAKQEVQVAETSEQMIASPTFGPRRIVTTPSGARIPGSYYLNLRTYYPAQVAAKLKIPILVLQGGQGYQVTCVDHAGWQRGLKNDLKVSFNFYPEFTHLFMPSQSKGTALGTPADYESPGHVDEAVINDIANWVLAQRGGKP